MFYTHILYVNYIYIYLNNELFNHKKGKTNK